MGIMTVMKSNARRAWILATSVSALLLACILLEGCSSIDKSYSADWSIVDWSAVAQHYAGDLPTPPETDTMSEKAYKEDCQRVDYRDFVTDPGAHKGERIYLKGTVGTIEQSTYQVPDSGLTVFWLGLGPMNAGDGSFDAGAMILWPGPLPSVNGSSVVAVWGECVGSYSPPEGTWTYPIIYGRYLDRLSD